MSPRETSPTTRRTRRPVATALAVLTAAALAIPALSACSAVNKAMDCANTAGAVVDSVDKLQRAVGDSLDDPQLAEQTLDSIDRKLKKVRDESSDPDLAAAVDKMNAGIKDARKDIKDAKAPNLEPISDAAGEMTKVCTPG
ncbi:hypothetical protein AB0D04_17175 [Streptomyces sp. NPDC048483]|uniref:hypothetical protein n=1 Tax=Streptomyces sp. NPDC048483 TaxID=3154927 RepID=UPI003416673F